MTVIAVALTTILFFATLAAMTPRILKLRDPATKAMLGGMALAGFVIWAALVKVVVSP